MQAQTEYVTRCDTAHFRMVREIRSLVEQVTLMDTLAAVDRTSSVGCACNSRNFSTNPGSPESLFTTEIHAGYYILICAKYTTLIFLWVNLSLAFYAVLLNLDGIAPAIPEDFLKMGHEVHSRGLVTTS